MLEDSKLLLNNTHKKITQYKKLSNICHKILKVKLISKCSSSHNKVILLHSFCLNDWYMFKIKTTVFEYNLITSNIKGLRFVKNNALFKQ